MKKNKKFWKAEAKSWRKVARIETDEANRWAGEAFILRDELEELKIEFIKIKNELQVLRQYNIGNKSSYTSKVTTGIGWSKNIPENPNKTKCNCKDCNCNK